MRLMSLSLWHGKLRVGLGRFVWRERSGTGVFCFQEMTISRLDGPCGDMAAALSGFGNYLSRPYSTYNPASGGANAFIVMQRYCSVFAWHQSLTGSRTTG